jgi:hypothetical protein
MPAVVPATPAAIAETTVQTGDTAMKTATVKGITVKATTVKAAKSGTVETGTVETAAVESTPTVKTSSATVRCLGEIWLAEQSHAQQPSCNARYTPPFLWLGSIG